MLTEEGRVLAVEDDGLWVETLKQSACGQCAAQKGCGQSLVAKSLMSNMSCIKAHFHSPTRRVWAEGDTVVIGIEESALLKAAFVSYLVPLLSMLIGSFLASKLSLSDAVTAFGALCGLLVGFLVSRSHSRNSSHRRTYHAVIVE